MPARRTFPKIIRHLYSGHPIEKTVNLLHPKVLEQLCENYLRSEFVAPEIRILYTTMKTGKTLPIVDIVGRSIEGRQLLVQITHHNGHTAYEKAKNLINIQKGIPNSVSIMFSADKTMEIDGLNYHYSTYNVFSKFNESPIAWHKTMIDDMLGIFRQNT